MFNFPVLSGKLIVRSIFRGGVWRLSRKPVQYEQQESGSYCMHVSFALEMVKRASVPAERGTVMLF